MPNIATVLKAEIARLARKEMRESTDSLKKATVAYRIELAGLKRRVHALEAVVKRLGVGRALDRGHDQGKAPKSGAPETSDFGRRFSAKGMATNRKRLGLSAADYALLVGTTGQSIYAWEAGESRPRQQALPAIAALRGIGKREAAARLAALKR